MRTTNLQQRLRRQRAYRDISCNRLHQQGHEVVAASSKSGVNTLIGEGLPEALAGAQVVVDVANSPSFEDKAVLKFFETSSRDLLAAEAAAGVRHHVALLVVGTDRLLEGGYFRAKMAQENLIKASKIPYTIVQSTQFFEFMGAIARSGTVGQAVHLPPALALPIPCGARERRTKAQRQSRLPRRMAAATSSVSNCSSVGAWHRLK